MFSRRALARGSTTRNQIQTVPAPVGGLNAINALPAMPASDAVVLENFIAFPDRVETRAGAVEHVTGFTQPVKRLLQYAHANGTETLFACCDNGIFDVTISGTVGAAVATIADGNCISANFNTGAGSFLVSVNGVDDCRQYNGTTWSTVATFGGTATNTLFAVEVYRQRLYFLQNNSMNLVYLPVNSVSGAAVTYNLGSIFRRGGALQAISTWTIDGGTGADDHLVIVTTQGEVAVFTGSDPAVAANWVLRGVYYIGRPLGKLALTKFGGDLLFNAETGLYPLSKALLTATINRAAAITNKIDARFSADARRYFNNVGWQVVINPDIPCILVNVPVGSGLQMQYCMHSQSGSWSTFNGWPATCWARSGGSLYFGTANAVCLAFNGFADFGGNITATLLSAFNNFGLARNKSIRMVRPTFLATASFNYNIGFAHDFSQVPNTTSVDRPPGAAASLWGTGIWGSAIWGGSGNETIREWRNPPDKPGAYKAFYTQVSSKTAQVSLVAFDALLVPGGAF